MRRLKRPLAMLLSACAGLAAATHDPDAYAQLALEIMNRARADPAAEAARLGIALNEGVPADETISTDPKQPLAFNPMLVYAARQHTTWMFVTQTFSHYEGGLLNSPRDRVEAAGYINLVGTNSVGENIAARFWSGPQTLVAETPALCDQLFVDAGYPDRAHRTNLLNPDWQEVGVDVQGPYPFTYNSTTYPYSFMITQDFGYRGVPYEDHFLTGVVYDDAVTDDDFYTIGEGHGGVTVVALDGSGAVAASTTSFSGGGYTLQLPAGTYDIRAWGGGGFDGIIVATGVVMGDLNLKLDLDPTQAVTRRSIRLEVHAGTTWQCSPAAPLETDETTHRRFDGLVGDDDHVLSAAPTEPG